MVCLRDTPVSAAELPESVIRYVARTQESVIIEDASAQNPFSADEYFHDKRARSVLCLPLVKQRALIALLYLENNLATRIFTPARLTVLNVLASQAAMSIENSLLYRDLAESEDLPGGSPELESHRQFRLGRVDRGNFLVRGNVADF